MDGEPRRAQQVETQLPSSPRSPSSARAFLRAALQTWELDGFGDVTELLTDELVTNVVKHVGSSLTVRATYEFSRIRIEVDDMSTKVPVLRQSEITEVGGRGLLLVAQLADDWGTEVHAEGKTVWFEIHAATATAEIHGDHPVRGNQ